MIFFELFSRSLINYLNFILQGKIVKANVKVSILVIIIDVSLIRKP